MRWISLCFLPLSLFGKSSGFDSLTLKCGVSLINQLVHYNAYVHLVDSVCELFLNRISIIGLATNYRGYISLAQLTRKLETQNRYECPLVGFKECPTNLVKEIRRATQDC